MKKTIAMIPARIGSERLPKKNLVLLDGKPLIVHAIRTARDSGVFEEIVVNGDAGIFEDIAQEEGVTFYRRPEPLGSSQARSDDVVNDFLRKHPCECMAWVNPICPLQPAEEVREVVGHFYREGLDSLITVRDEQVHCNFRGHPLNYLVEGKFARTQDLDPVQRFIYSVMMWRREAFFKAYETLGYAILFGKTGFYPVCWQSSILVKREEDIVLCRQILAGRKAMRSGGLEYYAGSRGGE